MVLGASMAQAWDDLYYLERAAQSQVLAMSTGRQLLPIKPEIALQTYHAWREADAESARLHLESTKRQLDIHEPDYAN